jgi:hypothetical protein
MGAVFALFSGYYSGIHSSENTKNEGIFLGIF